MPQRENLESWAFRYFSMRFSRSARARVLWWFACLCVQAMGHVGVAALLESAEHARDSAALE